MSVQNATQALGRDEFPILADSTYLVSHSMGAAPRGAKTALDTYWEQWAAEGPEAWETWLPQIGAIADGIGAIVGASPGSVFLGPNVSVLQAALATCIDFSGERNEVVYEALQFPSLTYVWREWERFGAVTCVVASDDGRTIPTERICEAITEKTALAVLSHAYYVSGAIADVRAIQQHCRSVGALLCVDAYQTTGVYPYDVTQWDLDLVTGGSHKWLCGGPGCAWIYVKPSLRAQLAPAVTGWMAHARPFAFEAAPSSTRRPCTAGVTARRRFRVTPLQSPGTTSSHRSALRAFANTTYVSRRRSPRWPSNAGCASIRRSNRRGAPDGSALTSTAPTAPAARSSNGACFSTTGRDAACG